MKSYFFRLSLLPDFLFSMSSSIRFGTVGVGENDIAPLPSVLTPIVEVLFRKILLVFDKNPPFSVADDIERCR